MSLVSRVIPLALAAALVGGAAHGGIVATLDSVVDAGDGTHRWSYRLTLTNGARVEAGAYVTIYDFEGFVPASNQQPVGFVFSAAMTGVTPGGMVIADDLVKPNLTFTWAGGALNGPRALGLVSARSTFSMGGIDTFAALAGKSAPGAPSHELPHGAIGTIEVPATGGAAMPAIPPPIAIVDVDGNGAAAALTDGLLLLRYAFGLRGAALVTGAVGDGCTRCDAPAIEDYLGGLP